MSPGHYGKGADLFLLEHISVVNGPHGGENYATVETLYEIERIKLHRHHLAAKREVARVYLTPRRERPSSASHLQIATLEG